MALQSQHDASTNELKEKLSVGETNLQEARTKLSNARYLAESFKTTEAYCQMEDDCLQYGVTLAVGIIKAKYPNIDYNLVQFVVNAWRNDENQSLDSMGIFTGQPLPTAPQCGLSDFIDTFLQGIPYFPDLRTLAKLDDIRCVEK